MTPRLRCPMPPEGGSYFLSPEQSHYLTKVLRLTPGAAIEVFDGLGRRFPGKIQAISGRSVEIHTERGVQAQNLRKEKIWLGQGLPSGDKMAWIIEKAVEIGVDQLSPLACERSIMSLSGARLEKKQTHWRAEIEAACMQSQRDTLMALQDLQDSQAWFGSMLTQEAVKLILEPSASAGLFDVLGDASLNPTRSIYIIAVGPESGFSSKELAQAKQSGFHAVNLGPQVLRTETAALVACSKLQAWLDLI